MSFFNFSYKAESAQIKKWIESGLDEVLIFLLEYPDVKITFTTLKCIKNILSKGDKLWAEVKSNIFLVKLEEKGLSKKLENLEAKSDQKIQSLINLLLDTYY